MDSLGDLVLLVELARSWLIALIDRLRSLDFVIQLAVLSGSGTLAYLTARTLMRLLRSFLAATLPTDWAAGIVHVIGSIAMPGLWLLLLWIAVAVSQFFGVGTGLPSVGTALLSAWVVIRLFANVVRNQTWQRVVFFVAWGIAALDILGLRGDVETVLTGFAFQYGEIRFSAFNLVRAIFALVALLWLLALLRSFMERRIFHAKSLTPSLQILLVRGLKLILPIVAMLAVLPVLGVSFTALTVFGGALAVGVGLGMQKTMSNLISGVSLLAGGSISPGDVIAVTDVAGNYCYGRVTSIGARHVSLITRNGIEHLVPNEQLLTHGVENWSHSDNKIRLKIPFGVSYASDLHKVMELALEAADAVPRACKAPAPNCIVMEFGDSSVNLELRIWIDDPMNGLDNVKSDCLLGLWDSFRRHGIVIPFPQRDLHIVSMPPGAERPIVK